MSAGGDRIEALLGSMTLSEKIGQMTQASNEVISPAEVADHAIGSVLSGGNGNPSPNTPEVWADMVAGFAEAAVQTRLGVPLVYGVDAVHGHSNVGGATVFPHNIGLGAIDDADLMRRIGRATAAEMMATGVRWTFAPTVAVPHDIRWGRTYEGYGRDPALVARLGSALVDGLHGDEAGALDVLACPKHFVGDGGTTWGTVSAPEWNHWWDPWGDGWRIDQGDTRLDEAELRAVHLPPYESTVAAGALSIMASYSSWNGDKLHGHRYLLTDVLKGELGFPGFVVSDWMGIDQLDADYDRCVIEAVNAGIDMVMVPAEFRRFIDAATRAVATGAIAMDRIDDAARRILRAKSALGLFNEPQTRPARSVVGHEDHRRLAAEAARRSAVLLKNNGALPVGRDEPIDLAGAAADDIGLQCGGWTVGWQGGTGATTPGTTLLGALRAASSEVAHDPDGLFGGRPPGRVGVVCIAEEPYAEGPGDSAVPTATALDREVFHRMRQRCEHLILVIYSGRPLVIPDLVSSADAVVAAWLPGTEATQLPGLLTGDYPFEGRLPQPWPGGESDLGNPAVVPAYPVNHGLRLGIHADSAATTRPPTVSNEQSES